MTPALRVVGATMKRSSEVKRLQARVRELEAEVERLKEKPARKPRNGVFTSPGTALSAWYAADPDSIALPGWKKTVFGEWENLPREQFQARMEERIAGTRELYERRRALFAAQSARMAETGWGFVS